MSDFCVFLLNKFPKYSSLVLRLRVVHFAEELPNLAAQALALDTLESLVETLPDALLGQMFDLDTEVGFNTVFRLYFLDRVHEDGHPLVLSVRPLNTQFVDRLVK